MVWLSPNAGKTYWLWSDAGYWHHVDSSFEVRSWSRGPSWQWAYDENPHLESIVSCCYHQLRRIRQVCRLVGQDVAQQLVSAFILSRLDYCNSLLSCLPRSSIQPLQRVMNVAARVIMNLSLHDNVKTALEPVEQRITYKLYCVCSCITSTLDKHHIILYGHFIRVYRTSRPQPVSATECRNWLRSTGSIHPYKMTV